MNDQHIHIDQQVQNDQQVQDDICIINQIEKELRFNIINDSLNNDKIKFYSSLLNIHKKDIKLLNLTNTKISIYLVNGNTMFSDIDNKLHGVTYMGEIHPRSMLSFISFTGYRYILENCNLSPDWISFNICKEGRDKLGQEKNKNIIELNIHDDIKDNILIDKIDHKITISKLQQKNIALFSSLKMNYLIKEMIRLGGLENPNFEPILDLHQDIIMPSYDIVDLEAAGVPNNFTNIT